MYTAAPTILNNDFLNPIVIMLIIINITFPIKITNVELIENILLKMIAIPPSPPNTKLFCTQKRLNDKADIKAPNTNNIVFKNNVLFNTLRTTSLLSIFFLNNLPNIPILIFL